MVMPISGCLSVFNGLPCFCADIFVVLFFVVRYKVVFCCLLDGPGQGSGWVCFLFPSGVIRQDRFIVVYCLLSGGFAVSLDWDFQISFSASEFDPYVCNYW